MVDYKAQYGFGVGDRVKVGLNAKKGHIAYMGETFFSKGVWVGIALEQKCGKHNGTILNQMYFNCEQGHGVFVRPEKVTKLSEAEQMGGMSAALAGGGKGTGDLPVVPTGGEASANSAFSMTTEKTDIFVGQTVTHFGVRAVVKYVGAPDGKETMVGLELEVPVGTSDGTYNGKRLFEGKEGHVVFVPGPRDQKLRNICLEPNQGGASSGKAPAGGDLSSEEMDRLKDFGVSKLSPAERKNLADLVKLAEAMAEERDAYACSLAISDNERQCVEEKLKVSILGDRMPEKTSTIDLTPFRKSRT